MGLGLHRRHSSAAKAKANGPLSPADDSPLTAAAGETFAKGGKAEDIVKWRDDMSGRSQATTTTTHPGFRGLWQGQGNVLMAFLVSVLLLVWYISLVWQKEKL